MKKLHKFVFMDAGERRVFLTAVIAMAAVRTALIFWPVHRIVSAAGAINRRWPARLRSAPGASRVAQRISQGIRFCGIPTTCLSESIAAQFVMTRWKFVTSLRIGVSKANGSLEAHAWLECPDGIVIGNPSPEGKSYTVIPSVERFFA